MIAESEDADLTGSVSPTEGYFVYIRQLNNAACTAAAAKRRVSYAVA